MKSFKKITAGVCSLVMLSAIATYAVSADPTADIGGTNSIGNSDIGDSGESDVTTPGVGDSGEGDTTTPGIGESGEGDTTTEDPNNGNGDSTLGNCPGVDFLRGDVNGDGTVNGKDLIKLKQFVLGLINESDINLLNSDVFTDSKVDGKDFMKLKKYILGLIVNL